MKKILAVCSECNGTGYDNSLNDDGDDNRCHVCGGMGKKSKVEKPEMRNILEDYFLAKIDWIKAFEEIANIQGKMTNGQALGICEIFNKLKFAECNVDEAEERLREVL